MTKATGKDHRDQPMYWFAILDMAREQDDSARAAEAKRQLARLGVYVSYRRRKKPAKEAK